LKIKPDGCIVWLLILEFDMIKIKLQLADAKPKDKPLLQLELEAVPDLNETVVLAKGEYKVIDRKWALIDPTPEGFECLGPRKIEKSVILTVEPK
jgi:hypothetical protein